MPIVSESFIILFVLAIVIERALAILFENKYIEPYVSGKKEIIAVLVSFMICQKYAFDIIAAMFGGPVSILGTLITALAVSGGSKVSLKIFRDWKTVKNS